MSPSMIGPSSLIRRWKEKFPRQVKELEEAGELREFAEEMSDRAAEMLADLVSRQGVPAELAQELILDDLDKMFLE